MRTVLYRIHLLFDDLEMVDRVFISNIESGEEGKIAERHRESVCVRGRAQLETKFSVGNKINCQRETFVAAI
jgi:hypothetical protein